MRQHRQHRNHKKGFTLAETLIALLISAVLLGIAMVGIIHYANILKLTEMDATAKQIFIAAQNHLTSAEASGELQRYEKNEPFSDEHEMVKKPADFPEEMGWPEAGAKEYYSRSYAPTDKANLKSGIYRYMLPFGAIDDTIRSDGHYVVEYNVKTATVYGVFYTDDKDGLNYLGDVYALDARGGRADSAEGRVARRTYKRNSTGESIVIGYYGGAMAGLRVPESIDKPLLEIKNEERLLLDVVDENYFKEVTSKGSKIKLQTKITVKVTGIDSKKSDSYTLDLTDDPLNPRKEDPSSQKWWSVKKEENKDGKQVLRYEVSLDDITSPGGHFAELFPDLIPGEDVTVDVSCSSNKVLTAIVTASGTANSLFAASVKDKDYLNALNVEAGYIRHLENLDPKISNLPMTLNKTPGEGKNPIADLVKKVTQVSDLDWKTYYIKGEKSVVPYKADAAIDLKSYYSIENKNLREFDGNGKVLKNFKIDSTQGASGLFAKINNLEGGVGFFGRNITMKNFDITGNGNAGAFVGDALGIVRLMNVLTADGDIVSTSGHAGGLIGYAGGGTEVSLEDSASAMRVKSQSDAGGVIGGAQGVTSCKILRTYSGGFTVNGEYSTEDYNVTSTNGIAGGFIGRVDSRQVEFRSCYSTSSVSGQLAAGGFVGQDDVARSSKYTSCYSTGLVEYKKAKGPYGVFAGVLTTTGSLATSQCLYGVNDEGMKTIGTGTNNPNWIISLVTAGDLGGTLQTKETYNFDPFYDGETYPFAVVNGTGAKNSGAISGVHFGDWPSISEFTPTEAMFVYRDKIGSNYKWLIVTAETSGSKSLAYNSLPTSITPGVSERPGDGKSEYGFLFMVKPGGDLGSIFASGTDLDANFGTDYKVEKVKIGKDTYYFLKLIEPGGSNRYVQTPTLRSGSIFFRYNPSFAGDIGLN